MTKRGINVTITGDYNDRDINRAIRDLNSLRRQSGATSQAFGYLKAAFAGAAIAAGAMALKLGIEGVQAAIADEQEVTKLTQAMNNLGLANDTTRVLAMIDAMQRQYGVSESLLRPSFQRLVTSLGDTGKAMDSLKLAMDISAGTGKSLDTVVAALGRGYDGNVGALGRLGVGLDKSILKTGDMALITQMLADKFKGQAQAAADSYQGQIERLSRGFDELKESFGYGFLEALGKTDTGIDDMMTTMKDLEPTIKSVGSAIGDTVINTLKMIAVIKEVKDAFDKWQSEQTGPFKVFVDGVVGGLTLMSSGYNGLANAILGAKEAYDLLQGNGHGRLTNAEGAANLLASQPVQRPEYASQVPAAARRAMGGPVSAGMPYIVGDGGRPELFVPSVDGAILPRVPSGSSGSGGYVVNYNLTVSAGVGDPRVIGQTVVEAITKFEKSNGPIFVRATR